MLTDSQLQLDTAWPAPEAAEPAPDPLASLARTASIEATPRQVLAAENLAGLRPAGGAVYVPFLPGADFADSLAACQRLQAAGLTPVPHLPARAIASRDQARDWLAALAETGVNRLMLIAGDRTTASGPFADTPALLASGLVAEHGFFDLGVAGHPDGHPQASRGALSEAMRFKQDYAQASGSRLWVVTQFAFEVHPILDWLDEAGPELAPWPIYLGLPGPTRLKTLLAYAAQCGVGASARALKRQPGTARLLRPWTPDRLVHALAGHHPARFAGLHLFPFGGLQRSVDWLAAHSDKETRP